MVIDIKETENKINVGDVVYSKCYNSMAIIGEDVYDGEYILIGLPNFTVITEAVRIEDLKTDAELELVCLHKDLVLTTK